MAIDLKLAKDDATGLYDLSLTAGDFTLVDSFDTSVQVSILGDERADQSEVPSSELRRGWWGNQFNDDIAFQLGSKLWLLYQARATQDTLNSAINFAQNSLQWLVDDGHAQEVAVTGVRTIDNITLTVNIFRDQARVETRYYDLWDNTGSI
jgi:phage gp46-like protein